jgi:hypothetical protein
MTRKRALELTVMAIALSVFGAFQFNLGMRHAPGAAAIVLDVTACELEPAAEQVTELQPL